MLVQCSVYMIILFVAVTVLQHVAVSHNTCPVQATLVAFWQVSSLVSLAAEG